MASTPSPTTRPIFREESVDPLTLCNDNNDQLPVRRTSTNIPDTSCPRVPLLDIPDDFVPGIRRRKTLPVSSQVPTPQGSDDEADEDKKDSDNDGDDKTDKISGTEEDGEENEDAVDKNENADDSDDGAGSDDGNDSDSSSKTYSRSSSKRSSRRNSPATLMRRFIQSKKWSSSMSSYSSDDSDASDDEFSPDDVTAMLDTLVGLDNVKAHFRKLKLYIQNNKALDIKPTDDRFHALFQGNPGTGKTTVAKLYAQFLKSMGVLRSNRLVETSGVKLAADGPQAIIETFKRRDGGVLFVDEAYQLVASHSSLSGKQVLDVILGEMDRSPPKWVLIFAGYKEDFEPFFAHNDGLNSRIPQVMSFEDFDNTQLHSIFLSFFKTRFAPRTAEIEDGPDGRFVNAVVRRIARSRARRGFGNARAVRNYFQRVCQHQAYRVGELANPTIEDRLFFTKEDLLGQKPLDVKNKSKTWAKLKSLIGLDEVKNSVNIMFQIVDRNYQRELKGKPPITHSLNRVFVGSPGTGKTTVAKLYGKILAELGFLSKGDVVIKTPADFIGDAVGKSESNTRAILASTLGKVLIIDEAYMLDPGDATMTKDSFKTAVLDTIVAEVQGNPGDDRCVLLLGYEDMMDALFQNGNPGLSGRFMSHMPFRFPDYSDEELGKILRLDLKNRHISYKEEALGAAIDVLSRSKYNKDFSNAREVKLLVSEAVLRNEERNMANQNGHEDFEALLEPQDFDPWLGPQMVSANNVVNCRADLTDRLSESVIAQLERILPSAVNRGLNRNVPRNFVFKGPPGTGKKTLARYMGTLFRDIGLLPANQPLTVSAKDFIGQHVGHTTPKTRTTLEKGFGRVLIIHDIHLLTKSSYGSEALDELTSFLRTYSGRMAVILTGPSEPVDDLLAERYELGTLFPDRITFQDLSPGDSLKMLDKFVRKAVPNVQTPFLVTPAATEKFQKALSLLSMFEGWGNATLIKVIGNRMLQKGDYELISAAQRDPAGIHYWKLTDTMAMSCIKTMFNEILTTGAAVKTNHSEPANDSGERQDGQEIQPTEATIEATSAPKKVEYATHHAATAVASRAAEDQTKKQDKVEKQSEVKKESLQEVIQRIGKCEQGYDWDRVDGGWRCKGGGHHLSDAEIAKHM